MFENKKILVCGMARSGQAAAILLREMGAIVTVTDTKADITFDADFTRIEKRLGENPEDFVENFDIIVISPGISVYAPFVKKAQALNIPVWGEAELAYRLCPCNMVAITGTNGKTTVTTLVGEIMKKHNPSTIVAGNIGVPLTSLVNTLTPQALVVAEISSFQLETIAAFRPKISAILNMTEDHLDRHLTMENYIAAKSKIFENQRQIDKCVLNCDNSITKVLKPSCDVVYFSAKEELENGVFLREKWIIAKIKDSCGEELKILNIAETRVMPENALAATAISLLAGAPPELIAETLRDFKGVPHRLEYVTTIDNTDYYNDSKATNTDAAIKALESFDCPIVLIAGGYDKKTDFSPWVRQFVGKVTKLILIGETAEKIAVVCEAQNFSSYIYAKDLQEAVALARSHAKPQGIVLFSPACASFDMFKDFEHRGEVFKQIVQC